MKLIKTVIVFAIVFLVTKPVNAQVDTALESKAASWVAPLPSGCA